MHTHTHLYTQKPTSVEEKKYKTHKSFNKLSEWCWPAGSLSENKTRAQKKITSDAAYVSPYILITQRLTQLNTNHILGKKSKHWSHAHCQGLRCFEQKPKSPLLPFVCRYFQSFIDTFTAIQLMTQSSPWSSTEDVIFSVESSSSCP